MAAPSNLPNPSIHEAQSHATTREPESEFESRLEKCVQEGFTRILDAFEHKLAYDAAKQRQIDLLHEELQKYRSDIISRAVRPIVNGMIRLHDDIDKLVVSLHGKPVEELSLEKMFSWLKGIQEDVELVLSQNGISAFREAGGVLNLRRQRVLRMVATSDQTLVDRVAESIRPGFEQGSELIEKERVAVYALEADPASSKNREG